MYHVYVIKSIHKNYRYTGITGNIQRRIREHNRGYNKTTKPYLPFVLIFTEECPDRKCARTREKQLKSGFGRELIDLSE